MASAASGTIQVSGSNSLFAAALWAQAPRRNALKLWLLFSAETILFAIIRLPLDLNFNAYAFGDRGSFLTVCYLAAHGGRPAVDFGYPYGLLTILVAQAWFRVFGLTPQVGELAMLACAFLGAWGLARFASVMRLGMIGIVLLVVALPFAILPSYQSFVYALEASVLCNALAEQAAGRRASALALVTAACLVKPSMGYVYGLVLLVLILCNTWRRGPEAESGTRWRRIAGSLAPAAVTGVILIALLGAAYGIRPLFATLLPSSGRAFYRSTGYGSFLTGGRDLWYRPDEGIGFYLLTVAGFWIAASLWLVAAGIRAAWGLLRAYHTGRAPGAGEEFVFTCAVLHVVFITTFFGGPTSWEYYSYVLVMGAAATSIWSGAAARIASMLALLALSGHLAHIEGAASAWRTTAPSPQTAGLWAPVAERDAWQRVLATTSGHNAAVVNFQGCTAVLFAQFERPAGAYLVPKESLESEIVRTNWRLEHSPMIFAVTASDYSAALAFFPHFRSLLDEREVVLNEPLDGITFTVYGGRKPR